MVYYPNFGANNNMASNQFYMQDLQNMRDKIDRQMQQVQQMQQMQQSQMQQSTQPNVPITQNFQIAPTQNNSDLESKYVENIDEVKSTFVMKTGIFLTKDLKTIWIKDVTGNIRTFETNEVIELDEKDVEINNLKIELENMKDLIIQQNQLLQQNQSLNNNQSVENEVSNILEKSTKAIQEKKNEKKTK